MADHDLTNSASLQIKFGALEVKLVLPTRLIFWLVMFV